MSKRFVLILVVIALLFGGLLIFTKKDAKAPSAGSDGKPTLSNHIYGEGTKHVTLVEYGDFQCPACGAYYPIVKELAEKYKTEITFQFRNFPLVELHKNALVAARAAEAASMQNKYWEMHDMLYENQQSWQGSTSPTTFFNDYATQLGLNLEKFKADSISEATNQVVQADRADGVKKGYNSTPTFIINGTKLEQNPRDAAAFEKLITDEIAKQNPS